MNNKSSMNDRSETTCSECGKTYQPDLAAGLGGGCPHCLARMLTQENDQEEIDTSSSLEAGDTLGGMEILEPLARGGMGVVYKARQIKLNRIVAIKVIDAKLAGVPEFTRRFEREARALAVLNHPNVVQVFDYGNEDGLCYLVMEWVDGTSLREILAAGHLSPDVALRYVPQICDALEYAHAQGVVHRDIKPENILIDRKGQLKIADFGIARMRSDDETGHEFVTKVGQRMGTPQYMAPEQQQHTSRVDHRADLYSLGVVFYEMLTGELPLGRFPNPSQRVKVDISLDEVVLKTLEHDPNQRYQRASEIKQALTMPSVAAPKTAPAASALVPARPRVTGFAWWSVAFAAMSLLVLWEMARSWVYESTRPLVDGSQFYRDDFYTSFLGPLSAASVVFAWVFGWLTLWRVRKEPSVLKGRGLALAAMLVPMSLLVLLIVAQVLPLSLRVWVDRPAFSKFNVPAFYIGLIIWVIAAPLLVFCLRGVFRRVRGYAYDCKKTFPVKTAIVTIIETMLMGTATWGISLEWNEARIHGLQLVQSLVVVRYEPADPEALHTSNDEEVNQWLRYVSHQGVLENNLFGEGQLMDLDHKERFACKWIDGEMVTAWMPSSRTYISFESPKDRTFRDRYRYLWIHEFDLEGDLLKVEYEFPLRGFQRRKKQDTEETLNKEERIRTKYGVEPDTRYRVEILLKDLDQYYSHGMDKEFWQSAKRVEKN